MSHKTATSLMNVAERFHGKVETVSGLAITALYELAAPSTPESVRTAVEELVIDGEKITASDIKRMKRPRSRRSGKGRTTWRPYNSEQDMTDRVNELERAVHLMAYIVVRHGEVYGPILDRLESELEKARNERSYHQRAIEILEAKDGGYQTGSS